MLKSLTRKFNKILPKGNKITPTTFVINWQTKNYSLEGIH